MYGMVTGLIPFIKERDPYAKWRTIANSILLLFPTAYMVLGTLVGGP
jgi:hypothetical protein